MRKTPLYLVLFLILISTLWSGCAHVKAVDTRPKNQLLVIAMDGVPYHLVKKMREEGVFTDFQEPTKVISTFPSTTTTGFGSMFHEIGADRPEGYDREFFSYETKDIQGFWSGIHPKSPTDFRNLYHYYRKSPFQKFWIYATPGASGRRDIEKIKRLVWKNPRLSYYLTYIGGTDGMGHVLGEKRLTRWLRFFDGELRKLREDYRREFGEDLDVALFSDHGFHYTRKPNAVPKAEVIKGLNKIGLYLSSNLKNPRRVVGVEWGNISGASFYCETSVIPEVAAVLSRARGVDLVAYPIRDATTSYKKAKIIAYRNHELEEADVSCDDEMTRCSYKRINGDPLHYGAVIDSLKRKNKMANDSARVEDWFEATKDHHYPDAPYRVYEGLFHLVRNPASVLLSTDVDYEYGDVLTRVGAWFHGGLKGTHGGLFQEASDAMAMQTSKEKKWPAAVRYNQVMKMILSGHEVEKRIGKR